VEAVLDMAVTTVSSLTESFFSGAPVQSPDYFLKEKEVGMMEASSEGSAMDVASKPEAQGNGGGQALKGDAVEAGESEESDFELEVHT
jgi:cleavage and polyadenylation specificity factor subunit 3